MAWPVARLCYALSVPELVPLAGIEPALLSELDFESSASTNSTTGAIGRRIPSPRSGRNITGTTRGSTGEKARNGAAHIRFDVGSVIPDVSTG